MTRLHDFTATSLTGQDIDLSRYEGKAVLVVNTASKCGFTPQYEGLEKLYEEYADQGLVVLGFPCDQFRHQEPGDEAEIAEFCQRNYGVTFPMFAKIDVNGPGETPLYTFLKASQPGVGDSADIAWNFTKFLVDAEGVVVARYEPQTTPEEIAADLAARS